MNDYVVSLIRTLVPVAVGALVAWLATIGFDIDSEALVAPITGILIAVYYAAARWAESRWPAAGALLGRKAAPTYGGQS